MVVSEAECVNDMKNYTLELHYGTRLNIMVICCNKHYNKILIF